MLQKLKFNSLKCFIMKSDNLIQISGYLTRDARINDSMTFASFSIAHKVNSADVMFFNCVLFAKDKNIPTDLLTKGKEVFVKGFMRPNNYNKFLPNSMKSYDQDTIYNYG